MATTQHDLELDGSGRSDVAADRGLKPILVTGSQAASLFSKSLRTWRSWDAAGLIPSPVRIGRSKLWSLEELNLWVASGCPHRKEWEARKSP
jgi:hypothetical protein